PAYWVHIKMNIPFFIVVFLSFDCKTILNRSSLKINFIQMNGILCFIFFEMKRSSFRLSH
ncbi:MAG TPA: hypothetical protein DDW18_03135, partial [Firmicutes bacterium]|nr:hypothetical protein [Bacillota bacterium]